MSRHHRNWISTSMILIFMFGMVIIPNNSQINSILPTNFNSQNSESNDGFLDTESPSSGASPAIFIENLDLAESTARWLYSQRLVQGSGITWDNLEGNNLTTYSEGAAGIGDFFVDLYEATLNSTYLNWAEAVGQWFVDVDTASAQPSGKWPTYQNEINAANYTGMEKGSAGIGTFLIHLAKFSPNNAFENLAVEIADELIASAQISTEGTGIRIKTNDFEPHTGPNVQPNVTNDAGVVDYNEIYGSLDGGSDWNDIANWVDSIQLNADDSTSLSIENDAVVVGERSITNSFAPDDDGQYFTQSFSFDHYPVYLDPDEGIKIRVYTTEQSGGGHLNLSVYEADQNGYPTGTRIGGVSSSWNATFTDLDSDGQWVAFNWSSAPSTVPVLNGTSLNGYCFKVQFGDYDIWNIDQSFLIKTTSPGSNYDGIFRINSNSYSEDVCFNITALPTSRSLDFEVKLNSTDFGLPYSYDLTNLLNMSININLQSSIANGLNMLQIFNYGINQWETLQFFSNSPLQINYNFYQPTIRNYLDPGALHQIKIRIVAGSEATPMSITLRQLNFTLYYSSEKYEYSWGNGAAGIGNYLLDCYEVVRDSNYLTQATLLANYLLEDVVTYQSAGELVAYWIYNNLHSLTYSEGVAGIGDFLLRVSQFDDSNSSYRDVAVAAARYITTTSSAVRVYDRNGKASDGLLWTGVYTSIEECGYVEGLAGIGSFLVNVLDNAPLQSSIYDFHSTARNLANMLTAQYVGSQKYTTGPIVNNLDEIELKTVIRNGTSSDVSLSYSEGLSGVLLFVSQLQQVSYDSTYGDLIGAGIARLTNNVSYTSVDKTYWAISNDELSFSDYGLYHGMAGIAKTLLQISVRAKDASDYGSSIVDNIIDDKIDDHYYSSFRENGLENGIAGVGLSSLEMYHSTNDPAYFNEAEMCADFLLDSLYWSLSELIPINYTGMSKGFAGIGTFMLEMYLATGDDDYLATSIQIGDDLIALQDVSGKWANNSADASYFTSYYDGAAGVVDYLLHLYEATHDSSYLISANLGLSWLLSLQQPSGYWCEEEGQTLASNSFTGYYHGTAGIADVFAYAYEITQNNFYLNAAKLATNYLCNIYTTQSHFPQKTTENREYIGMEYGYAGFWTLLVHISQIESDNTQYLGNLSSSVNYIINIEYLGDSSSRQWRDYYIIGSPSQSASTSLTYSTGMVGMLEVLKNVYSLLSENNEFSSNILSSIYRGKNYLLSQSLSTYSAPGYFNGVCKTAQIFSQLPNLDLPVYSSLDPATAPTLNYNEGLNINLRANDYGGSIDKVQLIYSLNNGQFQTLEFDEEIIPDDYNNYSVSLPQQNYNTNVKYYILIQDSSQLPRSILNAGTYFEYTVQDNFVPNYDNFRISGIKQNPDNSYVEYGDSLTYGSSGGGYFRLNVYEPAGASGIASISITYSSESFSGIIADAIFSKTANTVNEYYYRVPGIFNGNEILQGNDTFAYQIKLVDNAGMTEYISGSLTIADLNHPILNEYVVKQSNYEIKEKTDVPIVVNITDDETSGGSGVKQAKIRYSSSENTPIENWNEIVMGSVEPELYSAIIPGQPRDSMVYYYIVVEDNFGNSVAVSSPDQDNIIHYYEADEIPEVISSYVVYANWTPLIIGIGVAVAAIVIIFAITRLRGTYLDKVRREATSSARLISIKERFLGIYYGIAEKLNKMGDKMSLSYARSTLGERTQDWLADHVESTGFKILRTLRDLIKTYIKFLAFVVVAPFYLLWQLVTKAKGRNMLFTSFMGMLLIVGSVAKFFGDAYPLRAMFFINLGFILFIGSFIVVILHLIYDIVSK